MGICTSSSCRQTTALQFNKLAKVDLLQNPNETTQSSRLRGRKTSLGTGSCSSAHHPRRSIKGDPLTDGGQHGTRVHRRTKE